MKFAIGTRFSMMESSLLWKYCDDDSVDGVSFEAELVSLENWIKAKYRLGNDIYVRGNFFGDRTQYVEMSEKFSLDRGILEYLQQWLQSGTNYRARIALKIEGRNLLGGGVMIYQDLFAYGGSRFVDAGHLWSMVMKSTNCPTSR